jgi:Mor family transcriptional regulator
MIQLTDDQIKEISKHVEPDDLPGDLVEVAELLGTYKALLLGYHIGCGRIYLKPWSDNPNKWSKDVTLMVEVIGEADTKIVLDNFSPRADYNYSAGTHVDIYKCDRFWRQWRDQLICSSDNMRQIDLGRKHKLSDRWIRTIQKRAISDKRQPDLFISSSE